MSSKAFDLTPITRLYGVNDTDFNSLRTSTEMDVSRYDPYTLYLVNRGLNTSGNLDDTSDFSDGTIQYSDLYYGERRVTDVFVVSEIPSNAWYPDDKIYLVPIKDEEGKVWRLNGEDVKQPLGYNIYFKHKGIVTSVETSAIQSVNYNQETEAIVITWRTEDNGQVSSTLLTQEHLDAAFRDLSTEEVDNIINKASPAVLYNKISERIKSELIDPVIEDHNNDISDLADQLSWKIYE